MNAREAYNTRAAMAYAMRTNGEYTLAEIAKVLRLRSKEDVRKLLGRAHRLRKLSTSTMARMCGVRSGPNGRDEGRAGSALSKTL